MRLLSPRTIKILASHPEFPKTHLAHAWSEVFKFLASGQKHPKVFITDHFDLGVYLGYIWGFCAGPNGSVKLDEIKIKDNLPEDVWSGYLIINYNGFKKNQAEKLLDKYFDSNYLFSDACSLYYKGINIFKDIFGDEWRKYVPVESLKEIKRQVDKTLTKNL